MNDTRQEILRVALGYFSTMDYSAVKLEDIARDAHITRAPLYYYFKNKEGLFRALVEASLADAQEKMDALLSADEDVFEIIHKEYAYCIHGLGQYRRIWYPGPDAPDCREQVQAFSQWLLERKRLLLEAAREKGELSPDCDISEIITLIYVFYYGTLDVMAISDSLTGFNAHLLERSDEWFMSIVRERFGQRER